MKALKILFISILVLGFNLSSFGAYPVKKQIAPQGEEISDGFNYQYVMNQVVMVTWLSDLVNDQPLEKKKASFNIASLIFGLISFIFPPLAILAFVFALVGVARNEKSLGLAAAGFFLGIISIMLWLSAPVAA